MIPTILQAQQAERQSPSALSMLTSGGLIGLAIALVYVQVMLLHQFEPDLIVFAAVMLVVAALITTGWHWTPLLGALLGALVVAGKSNNIIYDLSHPESFHLFAYMVVAVSLALVTFVAGDGATLQNYRGNSRQAPRGTAMALVALAALGIGAMLVAALPRPASAGVDPKVLAHLPALTTKSMRYEQAELTVAAGTTIAMRLDNQDGAPHSFDLDELDVHVPVSSEQQSLVLFTPTKPGTYTFYCAVPGHREAGMQGTLIVE